MGRRIIKLDGDTIRFWRQDDGLLCSTYRVPGGAIGKWNKQSVFQPNSAVDHLFRLTEELVDVTDNLRLTNQSQAKHITDISAMLVTHGLWPSRASNV